MAKRIVVYCRESRDEDGLHFGRIETQRDILLRFVRERGLEGEIEVILDDNVSGTDFSRLDGISARAADGLVDVLVFKDASRLGRNLRESLNFLHRMDRCGVEVLFESEAYDPELFPLLAWFNERRAAEDSRKVRRVFRFRMQAGELVFRPAYGYRRSGHMLLPDPAAAPVVRRVFESFLAGESTGAVAQSLNRDAIPTPSTHPGRETARGAGLWNRQHIRRILADRVYTGDMCYQKTTKKSVSSKQIVRNPAEQWLVLPDHHEALVRRETFRQANELLARASGKASATRTLCFSGILYCGGCGARMAQRRRKSRADGYVCAAYQQRGLAACKSHFIREDALQRMAESLMAPILADEAFRAELCRLAGLEAASADKPRQLAERYERAISRIYDDMLTAPDMMPREIYEKKIREYTTRLEALNALAPPDRSREPGELAAWLGRGGFHLERAAIHGLFRRVTFYLPGERDGHLPEGKKGTVVFESR